MFKNSAGCLIIGTEYTSKHGRFELILDPDDGGSKFKTAFTEVAAYRFERKHFGRIASIYTSPLEGLIANDWETMLLADQSGTWPGPLPRDASGAAAMASRLGLTGFTISLVSGERAWTIGRDFILLGRRKRA